MAVQQYDASASLGGWCSATSAALSVPPDFHRAYDAPQRNDALVRVIWIQASPALIFPASCRALYNQLRQSQHCAPACDVQTLIWESERWRRVRGTSSARCRILNSLIQEGAPVIWILSLFPAWWRPARLGDGGGIGLVWGRGGHSFVL